MSQLKKALEEQKTLKQNLKKLSQLVCQENYEDYKLTVDSEIAGFFRLWTNEELQHKNCFMLEGDQIIWFFNMVEEVKNHFKFLKQEQSVAQIKAEKLVSECFTTPFIVVEYNSNTNSLYASSYSEAEWSAYMNETEEELENEQHDS